MHYQNIINYRSSQLSQLYYLYYYYYNYSYNHYYYSIFNLTYSRLT